MDNLARAEKIFYWADALRSDTVSEAEFKRRITSQLDEAVNEQAIALGRRCADKINEAVREAVKSANANQWYSYDHGFKEGFAAAKDMAAGIAVEEDDPNMEDFCGSRIAERIRSMQSDGHEGAGK